MTTKFTKYTLTTQQPVVASRTVTSSSGSSDSILNPGYFKTIHFLFRVIITALIIAGLIAINWHKSYFTHYDKGKFFHYLCIILLVVTVVIVLLYFFNIIRRLRTVPWTLVEAIICAIFAILFIISSALLISLAEQLRYYAVDPLYASAAIGFGIVVTLITEAIINIIRYRKGIYSLTTEVRTQRHGATTTTTTTTTAVVVH